MLSSVTSLRFEHMAHEAVTLAFLLRVAHVEAPERRSDTGVYEHGFKETPEDHE